MAKKRTNYSHKLLGRKTSDAGFTILELMISSSVFAVVLLVIAVGVINFTNNYYKGIISTETQSTARTVMADISQSIEFGESVNLNLSNGNVSGVCIDNTLYAYVVGQQVTDSSPNSSQNQGYHGLVAGNIGCSSLSTLTPYLGSGSQGNSGSLPSGARELLNQHMRLGVLSITPNGDLYTVQVRVIYGDTNLLTSKNWATATCVSGAGSQFCATANLTTTVEKRLI
jgi:prepilin-type N-terminal cleavage/methylation domain-containing protein